jgi:hypothetical protein
LEAHLVTVHGIIRYPAYFCFIDLFSLMLYSYVLICCCGVFFLVVHLDLREVQGLVIVMGTVEVHVGLRASLVVTKEEPPRTSSPLTG